MNSVASETVVRLKDFRAGDVSDRVAKAVNAFTSQVTDSVQDWRAKAQSAAKSTDGFVRANQWRAAGAIALAGMAAGVLVALSARRAGSHRNRSDAAEATSDLSGG